MGIGSKNAHHASIKRCTKLKIFFREAHFANLIKNYFTLSRELRCVYAYIEKIVVVFKNIFKNKYSKIM